MFDCHRLCEVVNGNQTNVKNTHSTTTTQSQEVTFHRAVCSLCLYDCDCDYMTVKTKRSLLSTIKKRKCQYLGHIIRGDGIQRLLMEGRINGRRGRGRPRTMWTDNIKEWTKMSYNDCIRVAQDRERWRSMTADLLTTDGT